MSLDTQIFFILISYSIISFILTYYVHIFTTKDELSRQDLSDIFPQLGEMIKKITSNYPIIRLTGIVLLSAFIAIIILSIFSNWIINSAIIPIIIYFAGPKLAVYFEETRVTISNNYADILETIYSRYYRYIMAGFLAGFGTKLIDNWINIGTISFIWFLINFSINTLLLLFILRDDIFE